jgi:hypothetical protein
MMDRGDGGDGGNGNRDDGGNGNREDGGNGSDLTQSNEATEKNNREECILSFFSVALFLCVRSDPFPS